MIILVTGASSSGKSNIAEQEAVRLSQGCPQAAGNLIYIATMHQYDEESVLRVKRHRAARAEKGFETVEKYTDICELRISHQATCLLECMSNLLANEMHDGCKAGNADNGNRYSSDKYTVVDKIISDVDKLANQVANLVIVTNEVFTDGSEYDASCIEYINNLGTINQRLAQAADIVIESVVGIPIYIKGKNSSKHFDMED